MAMHRIVSTTLRLWEQEQQFKLLLLLGGVILVWLFSPYVTGFWSASLNLLHIAIFAALYGGEPDSHCSASHIEKNCVYYVIGFEILAGLMNFNIAHADYHASFTVFDVILIDNYGIINTILFVLQLLLVLITLYVDRNRKIRRDRRYRNRDIGSGHYRIQDLSGVV